jgi:hypothetical protein
MSGTSPLPRIIEDHLMIVELADMLHFVADFLARVEGPLLRADFAKFTYGGYQLEELRADLQRFAGWLVPEPVA